MLDHLAGLYRKSWVVYCKPPFGSPEQVLAYLACCTHRVAISNQRLVRLEGEEVTFTWKDYAQGQLREMTLSGEDFLRRFGAAEADEVRLAVAAPEPHGPGPDEVRGLWIPRLTPRRRTGARSGPEGSTAMIRMILPLIVQFQCLSAQPWSEDLVYLARSLRYNHLREIAV